MAPYKDKTIKWQCPICFKEYRSKQYLEMHQFKHERTSSVHQCYKCELSFETNYQLKKHYKVQHSNNEPFRCYECGMIFNLKINFERHGIMHTRNATFKCNHCTASFNKKRDLSRHITQMHKNEKHISLNTPPPPPPPPQSINPKIPKNHTNIKLNGISTKSSSNTNKNINENHRIDNRTTVTASEELNVISESNIHFNIANINNELLSQETEINCNIISQSQEIPFDNNTSSSSSSSSSSRSSNLLNQNQMETLKNTIVQYSPNLQNNDSPLSNNIISLYSDHQQPTGQLNTEQINIQSKESSENGIPYLVNSFLELEILFENY